MNLLQLNPPIPIETPKGSGMAMILIDYGPDFDLIWVAFLDANGECWAFKNKEIRGIKNITIGRNVAK